MKRKILISNKTIMQDRLYNIEMRRTYNHVLRNNTSYVCTYMRGNIKALHSESIVLSTLKTMPTIYNNEKYSLKERIAPINIKYGELWDSRTSYNYRQSTPSNVDFESFDEETMKYLADRLVGISRTEYPNLSIYLHYHNDNVFGLNTILTFLLEYFDKCNNDEYFNKLIDFCHNVLEADYNEYCSNPSSKPFIVPFTSLSLMFYKKVIDFYMKKYNGSDDCKKQLEAYYRGPFLIAMKTRSLLDNHENYESFLDEMAPYVAIVNPSDSFDFNNLYHISCLMNIVNDPTSSTTNIITNYCNYLLQNFTIFDFLVDMTLKTHNADYLMILNQKINLIDYLHSEILWQTISNYINTTKMSNKKIIRFLTIIQSQFEYSLYANLNDDSKQTMFEMVSKYVNNSNAILEWYMK